jgi:hypothetical protein
MFCNARRNFRVQLGFRVKKVQVESVKGFNFQVTRHSSSMVGFSGRPSGSLPGPCQVSYAARGLSSSADSDAPAGTRSHGGRTFMRR